MKEVKKLLVLSFIVAGGALVGYIAVAQVNVNDVGTPFNPPSFEVQAPPYGPIINSFTTTPNPITSGVTSVRFAMEVVDVSGVKSAAVQITDSSSNVVGTVALYDDGMHSDGSASDGVFANIWDLPALADGLYSTNIQATDTLDNTTPESGGYIVGFDTLVIGDGVCATSADCTDPSLPQCCSGTCRAADICLADSDCSDGDACTTDICDPATCPKDCTHTTITACDLIVNDDCCPSGCDVTTDADCTGDVTPPIISITAPADAETITVDTYTVTANATDPESGIDRVEFYLDSAAIADHTEMYTGSDTFSWVFDVSSVANGSHSITAIAYNNAMPSLDASDSVTFTVDRPASAAPFNVAITAPAAGSTFSAGSNFGMTVHAEDDVSVNIVRIYSVANGFINEASTSGTSVDVNYTVNADSLAYLEEAIATYASESSGFKLPFIPVAKAAVPGENCTTTTNTYWDDVYAAAYDSDSQSTLSPQIPLGRTVTVTSCSGGSDSSSSPGA